MAIIQKKKIKIPVYNSTLYIYLVDNLKDVAQDLNYHFNDVENMWAITFKNCSDDNILYVAFTPDYINKVIAHECVHLVNLLFDCKGVKLNLEDDENQAYWTGWFYDEIEKVLKS